MRTRGVNRVGVHDAEWAVRGDVVGTEETRQPDGEELASGWELAEEKKKVWELALKDKTVKTVKGNRAALHN